MDRKNYSIVKATAIIGAVWFLAQGANLFISLPLIQTIRVLSSIALGILGFILIFRMSRNHKYARADR